MARFIRTVALQTQYSVAVEEAGKTALDRSGDLQTKASMLVQLRQQGLRATILKSLL